jgi:hypothetical protein
VTDTLIPSTGEVRPGHFVNLNRRGYRPRERVLFEKMFGRPEIGTIAMMDPGNPNIAIIEPEDGRAALRVIVVDIKGRLPAGATPEAERALVAALEAAFAGHRHIYDQHRKRILREHGVR